MGWLGLSMMKKDRKLVRKHSILVANVSSAALDSSRFLQCDEGDLPPGWPLIEMGRKRERETTTTSTIGW